MLLANEFGLVNIGLKRIWAIGKPLKNYVKTKMTGLGTFTIVKIKKPETVFVVFKT